MTAICRSSVPKQQTENLDQTLITSLYLLVMFPQMEKHYRSKSHWSGPRPEHNALVDEYMLY